MVFFLQRNTTLFFFVIAAYASSSVVDAVSGECIGNGVGQTCESSLERPNISCCVLRSTGAEFNACCPDDFGVTGVFKNTTIGDDGVSLCAITGTGVGCPTTDVVGNSGNNPIDYNGKTPCKRVAEVEACQENNNNNPSYNYGTCENVVDGDFAVCCVGKNSGTYAGGDSCFVPLPTSTSKDTGGDSDVADLTLVDATASASASASATTGIPTSISSIAGAVVTGAAAVTIVTTLFFL
jgi:hypothetical protein